MRETIDHEGVEDFAEALRSGAIFPLIQLVRSSARQLHPWDGQYRLLAHRAVRNVEVRCDIREGPLSEALVWACERNTTDGVRLSRGDKRCAITRVVQDPD